MAKGRKLQFPSPDEVTDKDPITFRNQAIALELYNQQHPNDDGAERLSQKVRQWYQATATSKGWAHVYFPRDYPTDNIAGVVFIKSTS